jgi:hypothetical protein
MNGVDLETKLISAGLTKERFSELTNTPMATIKNWMAKRKGKFSNCPTWTEAYLDLYIKNHENEIHIRKLIEELKRGSDNK